MTNRMIFLFYVTAAVSINGLIFWLGHQSANVLAVLSLSLLLNLTLGWILYKAWPSAPPPETIDCAAYCKQDTANRDSDMYDAAEELIFIAQQLVWLVSQSRTSLKKLTNLSRNIARDTQVNASGAEEAAAGIQEVAHAAAVISLTSEEALKECQQSAKMAEEISRQPFSIGQLSSGQDPLDAPSPGQSLDALKEIMNNLLHIEQTVENLYKLAGEQRYTSEQMAQAVEMITESTVEIATNTNKALERVNAQEESVGEIYSQVKQLTATADKLHELASLFRSDQEIVFGVNPFLAPRFIKENYVPILEAVAYHVGLKARVIIVSDYEALGKALLKGTIDVGWFSPLAYVSAKAKGNILPLVTPVVNNTAFYHGYIIARKDREFTSIDDLKGKRFGFVDPQSASGYLFPKTLLTSMGKDPDTFFSESLFLTSHYRVIDGVLDGTVDAGATYSEALDSAKGRGTPLEQISILFESDPIPKDAIAARRNLNPALAEKLKEAFLSIKDQDMRYGIFMKNTSINGFIEAQDAAYDILRKASNTL